MNLLFIDDNSTVQKVNVIMLRKLGYLKEEDKIFFKNTTLINKYELDELLSICSVIICDYNLGANNLNGLEFFETIKEKFIGLKILLTSNDSEILKETVSGIEDIYYITKTKTFLKQQETTKQLGECILSYKNNFKNNIKIRGLLENTLYR